MPKGLHKSPRIGVARIEDFPPGATKVLEVEGRSVGLFNVRGTIVAVQNVCPHAGAPVCVGRVGGTTLPSRAGEYLWGREGEILVCPWHGWEFDLLTGRALADRRRHLRLFPVDVEAGVVYVTLRGVGQQAGGGADGT